MRGGVRREGCAAHVNVLLALLATELVRELMQLPQRLRLAQAALVDLLRTLLREVEREAANEDRERWRWRWRQLTSCIPVDSIASTNQREIKEEKGVE